MINLNHLLKEGDKIENTTFDRHYIVVDMEYCNLRDTVLYTFQQQRFKFNMFKIGEPTVKHNLNSGSFKLTKTV